MSLGRTADSFDKSGKKEPFEILKPWLMGDPGGISQSEVADQLGTTDAAAQVARPIARKIFRKRPSQRALDSRREAARDKHPAPTSNDESKVCWPEHADYNPRIRHAAIALLPSVSEKIFGNGSICRLRQKFAKAIRREIAETVEAEEEIAGELRYLIEALSACRD